MTQRIVLLVGARGLIISLEGSVTKTLWKRIENRSLKMSEDCIEISIRGI